MEVLMQASPATYFPRKSSKLILRERFFKNPSSCLTSSVKRWSFQRPFSTPRLSVKAKDRKLVITEAKKKKKTDSHSFIPKPDETTGPFPEAVLLKEKKVQEDGRLAPEFADAEEEKLFEFLNLQLESDLNLERMRHYEVVYLIHENHVEEVGSVNSKVEGALLPFETSSFDEVIRLWFLPSKVSSITFWAISADFIKEKQGKIWRLSDWGLRRLAYKIKKAKNANYILMNFELEAKWINDLKSMLDKDERVIRHLVIKRDEAITEDCPPPLEFHTMRANGDDEDVDDDDDYAFDDEDEEEWADDGKIDMDRSSYTDDVADGIIFVDEEDDVGKDRSNGSSRASKSGKERNYA
ncbi:Ribosomal protein S6 [Macleaya cordata]|uniref:Ribosomal protein S6 n=1 Tax=Macleaya cordata TaxID=56857 RepID=A0A200R214_MACCD|nr:Ribosomal protein S6 [Macleaya cordata]